MIQKKIKDIVRKILWGLHIDITQNLRYDRQTIAVMKKVLKSESNCIDVGCHKGEMLDLMLNYAPQGKHFAFEPLPHLYKNLQEKYRNTISVQVSDIALWNQKGSTTFNYVVNAPAYSGIKERQYKNTPQIEILTVQTDMLDNFIPPNQRIDFIKIDVEGGELGVLQGAMETIKKNKPVIIFESGIGASDYYNTQPGEIYQLLKDCGLDISLMSNFLKNKPAFALGEFEEQYYKQLNYYFIAYSLSITDSTH